MCQASFFGNSLTSISGSGSDLSYTLTTQETATDNSVGTYHLDQSDGISYDASLSGLDTYSISRFSTTTIEPTADVTTTAYTETGNIVSLWQFSGEGSYSHEINEADTEAGTSKLVSQDSWWTDESETSWSDVYTEIATLVVADDDSETKTGKRLENVNSSVTSSSAWGGSFTYAETFIGQVPLVDPASEQTPGESPDGTPDVPPADPVDVPAAADDTLTTIAYSQQWTGSQSQNDYDSYGDVITFGPSGVTTTARLGFGGGYAVDLVSSSTLAWTQTTGDAESANWSIAAYGEDSQFDLSSSGGYLSMTNLTIVDGGSDPLVEGLTGTFSEDGSDHTNILITTHGATTYSDAAVVVPDGPTVEPTVTSSITSVDNFDDTIHIVSGDTYNDLVTFSGSDSLALEHSQTDTYSFSLTSLGDGSLFVQTAMDYPEGGDSLATFDESYTQTMLLDSGSTTNSSFAVQTVGEVTTVSVGPITETGSSTSSFAYAAIGTSTFHSSEPGIYTAAVPTPDPITGEQIDPTEQVASPFEGLPTLTTMDSNETWTDSLSFSNQSEYEQTINFNSDGSWSLTRTETGSGDSSFNQSLISTLTINDEVGSLDDGLGAVFTFTETSNVHSWDDGQSSYVQTLALVSAAPSDPAETNVPEGETLPPEDPDITISLTHNETGESTSGLTLQTTGTGSYQSIGGTAPLDQVDFSADWESSFVQSGSSDYEASLAWNSNGSSSYSESGSLLTEYLVTGSRASEYDQGFDSSVDGMHASSTQHFTASESELINYAVATQVSVIVPTDDGSGNSLDPITTISQSESISVSGNAHAESDVLDLVYWAGDVENTSIAADGSQAIDTEGVIYDSATFTQSMFDEIYSSTEQFSLEYASDTGLTLSGNQTSESEVSGSLDIATDISTITTGADQLSTLGVLTNSFHRTFAGSAANSSAYTLTKAVESEDVIAEYLSSSSSSLEVTDTNVGTFQESAPTSDNTPVLAPVSDWNEFQQLTKTELTSISFDGQTWSLAASGSGSLTTNGIYLSTLPGFGSRLERHRLQLPDAQHLHL